MGTIGLDFTDKEYRLKDRILGVEVHQVCFRDAISLGFTTFVRKCLNSSTKMRSHDWKI